MLNFYDKMYSVIGAHCLNQSSHTPTSKSLPKKHKQNFNNTVHLHQIKAKKIGRSFPFVTTSRDYLEKLAKSCEENFACIGLYNPKYKFIDPYFLIRIFPILL